MGSGDFPIIYYYPTGSQPLEDCAQGLKNDAVVVNDLVFFLKTGSDYAAPASLELIMQTRLATN